MGAILLPDTSAALSSQTNKLYNLNGTLIWNGTALGSAGSAGGWTDEGTVVRLTTGTDKVGIGDASPTYTLDVAGKIGVNDTQVIYLPDQTDFTGTIYIGDGGGSLSHTSGEEAQFNTAVGYQSLYSNTTGARNTAIGYFSLQQNTTGDFNVASGYNALHDNTTGHNNTASGYFALHMNTTGYDNTAIGASTLYSSLEGNNNTAIGNNALYRNRNGNNNIGLGWGANRFNRDGSNNTIVGYEAGLVGSDHSKSGNVFLGYQAGYSETGDNKLYIENSNSTSPLIGGDFAEDEIYLNGDVGIGTTEPESKLHVHATETYSQILNSTVNDHGLVLSHDGTYQAAIRLDGDSGLAFLTGGAHITNDLCMSILSNGNVGIGGIGVYASPPASRLVVKGSGNTSGSSALDIVDSDETSMLFVRDDGNVGIGTTSPQVKLHVNAVMRLEPQGSAPSGGLGDLYAGTDGKLYFHNGTTWKELQMTP